MSPIAVNEKGTIVNGIFERSMTKRIPIGMSNGKDQHRGLACWMKCSMTVKITGCCLSVNYHEFTCAQKVVRCVSMA
jgi:hypothetical protein